MSYPASLDNLPTVSPGEVIASSLENQRITAINAIEVALGTNPFGPFATVAAAILAMASAAGIQKTSYTYADDTGTTNACAVALTPAVT
ncbi:MAG: hypothetical protein ACYCW6_23195, partial [Candidatus Xenobia bacterium]